VRVLSGVKFCPHCRRNFSVCLSNDIGVRLVWVGDELVFNVALLDPEFLSGGFILYQEVYGFAR
jgi:hypothetical protein